MTLETAAVTSSTVVMEWVLKGEFGHGFSSFLANFLKYIDDFSGWRRLSENVPKFDKK